MEWQPIETAPRVEFRDYSNKNFACALSVIEGKGFVDVPEFGREILVFAKPFFERTQSLGNARCFVAYWDGDRWANQLQGMYDRDEDKYELIPTHWMPLPSPPTS